MASGRHRTISVLLQNVILSHSLFMIKMLPTNGNGISVLLFVSKDQD